MADLVSKTSEWGHKRGFRSQGTSIVNRSRGGWIERLAGAVHNWPNEAMPEQASSWRRSLLRGCPNLTVLFSAVKGFEGARLQRNVAVPLEIAKLGFSAAEGFLINGEKSRQGAETNV